MSLDPTLQAEFNKDAFGVFFAIEVILPGAAIRLLDGSGVLTFGGNTFTGRDDTYGVLGGIQPIADGIADQAPTLTFQILPPDNSGAAALCNPANQGSLVQAFLGAFSVTTGLVVGTPLTIFAGEVDVPTLTVEQGARVVELSCVSVFERMFSDSEGARLTNQFHQSLFPGELGLEYVTNVQRSLPWGQDAPRPAVIIDRNAEINASNAKYYS